MKAKALKTNNYSFFHADVILHTSVADSLIRLSYRFLMAYPKGCKGDNHFSLFLRVADYESLPSKWRRHARYSLSVVNHYSEKLSYKEELEHWFHEDSYCWGYPKMLPLYELHAKDSGFLVKGDLKIVAEIEVPVVIGKLDVPKETSITMVTTNVNGFQLLPSQVEPARRIFERHPEIESEFNQKKPSLRIAYMSLLLSLIETMCQLPEELSNDDLCDTYDALRSMRDDGFKLDWLTKKFDELWEKKRKEEDGETLVKETEEELNELKQRCSDLEAELEKEKAEVSAAKAPFSFDDVF